MSGVQIHFDGDIAQNHQVSLRTLGKTLTHLQSTFDRAYLELHHGNLWKYAKMHHSYYDAVELLVQEPREGGYILDFLTSNPITRRVIDRVAEAVNSACEQMQQAGLQNAHNIKQSIDTKLAQIDAGVVPIKSYDNLLQNPDGAITRKYADRAIVREVDQILSIIRSSHSGDSTFELELNGTVSQKFEFNKAKANTFHKIVTNKQIGDPVAYKANISVMDRHNLTARIVNKVNGSIATLHFINEDMFQEVISYFDHKTELSFLGAPYIEYGAFDPLSGDIYYLRLI
ncbi:hypothetical protein QNM34_06065 [Rahnella bonaserana]|uniref:hypothetical protein n=1 Tax=Rahnella bonaserana TaxID=2816248 RepID=UPI0024C39887|nr:hypothetical protein [Rahnella bonaserana]WHZ41840.1 hypothetical protein QNM34_06065 [Rahnella bonaserana]